jgi:hypothetical protein
VALDTVSLYDRTGLCGKLDSLHAFKVTGVISAHQCLFLYKILMMRLVLIAAAIVCSTTIACNNPGSENNKPAKSLSDSLLQQVLDGHDVAMPKMMKLQRLQKEAVAEMDSLKKLPGNHTTRIALLDSTVKNLDYADVAMNVWMEGFRYDSLKDNEPARIDYLKIQLEEVNKVKDVVLSSVEKADSVLAK